MMHPSNPPPFPKKLRFFFTASLTLLFPRSGGVGVKLSVEQISKAQKLCKYAVSSLDYDDLESAILNLNKALHLCQTGQEMK